MGGEKRAGKHIRSQRKCSRGGGVSALTSQRSRTLPGGKRQMYSKSGNSISRGNCLSSKKLEHKSEKALHCTLPPSTFWYWFCLTEPNCGWIIKLVFAASTILRTSHVSPHLIFTTIPRERTYHYPHFTDEQTEVRKPAQGPATRNRWGQGVHLDGIALSQLSHHSAKSLPVAILCLSICLLSHENSLKDCHQFVGVCLLGVPNWRKRFQGHSSKTPSSPQQGCRNFLKFCLLQDKHPGSFTLPEAPPLARVQGVPCPTKCSHRALWSLQSGETGRDLKSLCSGLHSSTCTGIF